MAAMTAPCCHFDLIVEIDLCVDEAPGLGYLCTRPAGHGGAHTAHLGGRLLDTWPQEDDTALP